MAEKYRKLSATFVFAMLLVVVGGFCYGPAAKAEMGKSQLDSASEYDCNGERVVIEKSTPSHDSVMPCCLNSPDNSPAAKANSSGGAKLALIENSGISYEKVAPPESQVKISFKSSPPKPDKLSSVLRLE